ncbi:uncharacterized protein PHACADRAFT_97303, partial [Phanerochaete carnosa HHB-10118-sp]
DVSIEIYNSILIVSGGTKLATDKDEKGYVLHDGRHGKLVTSLQLPQGTKANIIGTTFSCYLVSWLPEEIEATMENGVLMVTFSRTSPKQAPKQITVN